MIKHLPTVPSTNTWLKEHASEFGHGDIVVTDDQTAGRGQRGNFWEAEPGKNLTFSMLLKPDSIAPARQFVISECVALGVSEVLRDRLSGHIDPDLVKVKWPNDIYVGDDKIAGILIEHAVNTERILHTVAGIGLNVNQTIFHSSAPNPVSMAQLAGHASFSLTEIMEDIAAAVLRRVKDASRSDRGVDHLHEEFHSMLWRNDGNAYRFMLASDTSRFVAVIDGVDPDGMLRLRLPDGEVHRFAFKEVVFI